MRFGGSRCRRWTVSDSVATADVKSGVPIILVIGGGAEISLANRIACLAQCKGSVSELNVTSRRRPKILG